MKTLTTTLSPLFKTAKENCNVKEVKAGLCTGCGTCAGICPNDAIKMYRNSEGIYLSSVNDRKCKKCGLCLRVCTGYSINFNKLNSFVFGKIPKNSLLGNYINCYVGHSTDSGTRWNASSGGIVTSLLLLGLEKQMFNGVLVIRMRKEAPMESEAVLAQTKDDVITALGSKYCPATVNVGIRKILDGKGKYAIVGLPCHIHGLRKAQMFQNELKEKVVLHIGLFCSHNVNFLGTELFLEKLGVKKENVTGLSYRGKGWPGEMSIKLTDGCEVKVSYKRYWDCMFGAFFFTPLRCTLCADATNELADISVGDPWLPEYKNEHLGESIIVTRTDGGEDFLRLAELNEKIEITEIDPDRVRLSQKSNLNFKKKTLETRISFLNRLGKDVPSINPRPSKIGRVSYLGTIFLYLSIYISSKKRLRQLLKLMPSPIMRMYFRFLCALFIYI